MCYFSPSALPARTVSEEWSSSGDSKNEEDDRDRRSPREKEGKDKEKEDCEIIRVFDGNASLKKRLYRTISVPRNATVQAILVSWYFKSVCLHVLWYNDCIQNIPS